MSPEPTTSGQSRGGLLKRALVLAAGAVGIGAGGKAAAAPRKVLPSELTLFGRNWFLQTPERKPGERIRPGDHGAVYGELLDRPHGKTVGRFSGSRLAIESSPGGPIQPDASIELHTFRLRDGTIFGIGSAVFGESVFAIVGGTGRYAGARGTYVARQRLREHGGDGTADFILTLTA